MGSIYITSLLFLLLCFVFIDIITCRQRVRFLLAVFLSSVLLCPDLILLWFHTFTRGYVFSNSYDLDLSDYNLLHGCLDPLGTGSVLSTPPNAPPDIEMSDAWTSLDIHGHPDSVSIIYNNSNQSVMTYVMYYITYR